MRGPRANRLLWAVLTVVFAASLAACSVSMTGGVLGALSTLVVAGVLLFGVTTQSGCDSAGSEGDVGPCLSVDYIGPCLGAPYDPGPDTSQDVATPDVGPCLQPPWDVGPCLSDVGPCLTTDYIGPCLDQPYDVGPCLEPPYDAGPADVGEPDIGPCLDYVEDVGPCLSPPWDAGAEDAGTPDIGPCLSPAIDAGPADAEGDADDVYFGPCLSPPWEPPPDADATDSQDTAQAAPATPPTGRAAAVERLAARGALPEDVLARLRARDDARS